MKCIGWPKNSYATIKSFEELFSRKVSIQICALRHHAVQQALELSTIKATSGKLVMQWQFWHEVKKKSYMVLPVNERTLKHMNTKRTCFASKLHPLIQQCRLYRPEIHILRPEKLQ